MINPAPWLKVDTRRLGHSTPQHLLDSLPPELAGYSRHFPYVSTLAQVPNFSINGLGFGATGPYYNPGTYLIMFANVTHTRGRQTLRAGFNFEDMHLGGNSGGNNTGNFAFTAGQLPAGVTTFQQSFANFLLGQAASFTQLSVDASHGCTATCTRVTSRTTSGSPRLTVNAGRALHAHGPARRRCLPIPPVLPPDELRCRTHTTRRRPQPLPQTGRSAGHPAPAGPHRTQITIL